MAQGDKMAERVGFEPTIPFQVRRISSAVLSTTQPPLQSRRRSSRKGLLSKRRKLVIRPLERKRAVGKVSAGVEHHLGTAEHGDDLARRGVGRLGVPDLGHAAAVEQAGLAGDLLADPGGT